MAFRNGIISDTLRKAGSPFEIIFGLQLPQLKAIAAEAGKDSNLGHELWADKKIRESRILALMLLHPEDISFDEALDMTCDIRTREEADLLPFLLLRNTPHIPSIISHLQSMTMSQTPAVNGIAEKSSTDPNLRSYIIEALSRFV